MRIVWRVKEICKYFSNHMRCLTEILRSVRATLTYKIIIHFSMTISKVFWTFLVNNGREKTWKNIGNLSGKPGKPGILLTKMRLPSKKAMEIGQKMVWKTGKPGILTKIKSGHPANFCLKNLVPLLKIDFYQFS